MNICLGSRYPIVIWWGHPAYTMFYNDSYISFLGVTKHPGWLGRSGRECWREIWPTIGPMLEGVFATGQATWSEDLLLLLERNIPQEEAYFTFSYSAILDDAGKVGGIFCACYETTGRVLSERRLRSLRDLGRAVPGTRTASDACATAAQSLATNPSDIPFALIHLLEADGHCAKLAGQVRMGSDTPASPRTVDVNNHEAPWPFRRAVETGMAVEVNDVVDRFGPLPGGAWPESPRRAVVVPMAKPGQTQLAGFLVVGVSPRLVFNEPYKSFVDLLAAQVATAVASARAYEETSQRAEFLAELDRAKTAFFSNVSHEFRTPLTLILGPLEDALANAHGVLPEGAAGELAVAHRNGLRLLKLVNTLLDFSRLEAGRIQASYEPTDLAACTADLVSVFRSAIEKAGLELVVDCPSLPEAIYVDREMWEKIVLNLLSNAFKFTFEGKIQVALRWCGERVELCVSDTGVGIPEPELPRIFERFHRVRGARSRTHEGTGIGLALVEELVRLHGGEITARSQEGRGAAFTISLPSGSRHLPPERIGAERTVASTSPGAAPYVEEALRWLPQSSEQIFPLTPELPGPGLPGAQPSARILLAEDNADMRDYVRRLLLAQGYEVLSYPDGRAALESARLQKPDLILSDIMMPLLDGVQLLSAIREDEALRSTPVILLSARAGEEARLEGIEHGADDYLTKPFSSRELLARVSTHLKLAGIRQEAAEEASRSKGKLASIVEYSDDAILSKDLNGVITSWNRGAERLFGYSAHEAVGQSVTMLIPPERANEEPVILERIRKGESVEHYETIRRRKDGRLIQLSLTVSPIKDAAGKVIGASKIARDITERKNAEKALREAQLQRAGELEQLVAERTANLQSTVAELEHFSYTITHDMRAPLRALLGFGRILMEESCDRLTPEGADYLRRIIEGAHRLDSLIQDSLQYARIIRNRIPLAPVEPCGVLRGILESYPDLQKQHTEIQIVEPLPPVIANAAGLSQCFSNLLANAIKFVKPGQAPQVRVWAETRGDYVRFWFEDNGIGIPPQYHERIFEMFQQLDKRYEGTGIGLALVRKTAERMEGKVGVESESGKGSRFWLDLKRADQPMRSPTIVPNGASC